MLGITDHVWSENLAVDDHDNLFFAYIRDGVRLATSRDGGRSWRLLGLVSPPGLRHAIVVSVTARGRGEVALTLLRDAGQGRCARRAGDELARMDDVQPQRARRQARCSTARRPRPSRRRRWARRCTAAARPSRPSSSTPACSSPRRREVRGAFTRWTGKHLPELVLAKLRLPSRPPPAGRATVVLHIRRGLRRVTVTANGRRLRVRGRPRPPLRRRRPARQPPSHRRRHGVGHRRQGACDAALPPLPHVSPVNDPVPLPEGFAVGHWTDSRVAHRLHGRHRSRRDAGRRWRCAAAARGRASSRRCRRSRTPRGRPPCC